MFLKQLREAEAELEEERKQRAAAGNAKKKLEGDLKNMEGQVEMAQKIKEDSVRQMRKLQAHLKEYQREVEEAQMSKEDMANHMKENDKKLKNLEADLLQMQEDLAASERARKQLEGERDELQDEINNSANNKWVMPWSRIQLLCRDWEEILLEISGLLNEFNLIGTATGHTNEPNFAAMKCYYCDCCDV